jgi:hypothetical protein
MTEEQLRREVERLFKTCKMPALEELSAAVLEARKKYANKIRSARREIRENTPIARHISAHTSFFDCTEFSNARGAALDRGGIQSLRWRRTCVGATLEEGM